MRVVSEEKGEEKCRRQKKERKKGVRQNGKLGHLGRSRYLFLRPLGGQGCRIPCLFGCSGEHDALHHYVMCPHAYALIKFFNVSGQTISSDPLERLGLVNPNLLLFKFLCVLFDFLQVNRS